MSRKPVLEGGKRDEIISAAMELFFQNGYEATSVRMILEKVSGEVGMFYHYFKSKEELFQVVVECFFTNYQRNFIHLADENLSIEEFSEVFLKQYEESMILFHQLSGNMHWTIQYAMAGKTIDALRPAIAKLLLLWHCTRKTSLDIVVGQFLYGIAATLHTESFNKAGHEEKKRLLLEISHRMLYEN